MSSHFNVNNFEKIELSHDEHMEILPKLKKTPITKYEYYINYKDQYFLVSERINRLGIFICFLLLPYSMLKFGLNDAIINHMKLIKKGRLDEYPFIMYNKQVYKDIMQLIGYEEINDESLDTDVKTYKMNKTRKSIAS